MNIRRYGVKGKYKLRDRERILQEKVQCPQKKSVPNCTRDRLEAFKNTITDNLRQLVENKIPVQQP